MPFITPTRWSAFTGVLYDEVKKFLLRNNISTFTDLSVDERDHLVQEIENSLAGTPDYHNFATSLNILLETHLSETVQRDAHHVAALHAATSADMEPRVAGQGQQQQHQYPTGMSIAGAVGSVGGGGDAGGGGSGGDGGDDGSDSGRSPAYPRHNPLSPNSTVRRGGVAFASAFSISMLDHLVDTASDAAVAILESFDDMREELKMLFNQRFPAGVRRFLWRAKLRNGVHHLRYAEIFASEHKATISVNDGQIGRVRVSCRGVSCRAAPCRAVLCVGAGVQ